MKSVILVFALAAIAVGSQPTAVIADEVPKFDAAPSCRDASNQGMASMESCMADEQRARDQLAKLWAQFTLSDKANCTQEASDIAGLRSYVELLTCLQIARDAKSLSKEE